MSVLSRSPGRTSRSTAVERDNAGARRNWLPEHSARRYYSVGGGCWLTCADDRRSGVLVDPVGLRNSRSTSPAAVSCSRNSCWVSAPAMQPVHACMSALVASSMSGSAITSETAKPSAGPEHPRGLGQHLGLVAGEVDHAVGDHHVDACVGERELLEVALDELDVRDAGLGGVGARELEHLVGHVEPDRPCPSVRRVGRRSARRSPAPEPRSSTVSPVVQVSDGGRDPAPQ